MALRLSRWEFTGIAVGAASGSLIFAALPIVVGSAIAAFGDPVSAGLVASMELLAMGVTSSGVSARLRQLPGRKTALISALLLIISQILSSYSITQMNWPLFVIARITAGLSEGALFTICIAFMAKVVNPDRGFTVIALAQTIANAVFFGLLTLTNANYDPSRTFILFGCLAFVSLIPLILIPPYRTTDDREWDAAASKAPFSPAVKTVLLGFAIYSIGLYMLFPYVEDIGINAGFSHAQIAGVFTIATLAAFGGPFITHVIGNRFGRLWPILIAIGFQIASAIILISSTNLVLWGAAQITSIAMIYVLNPFLFGLLAHLDITGRAASAATGIMAITAAAGPAFSSFALTVYASYPALGWLNAFVYVLMAGVVVGPLIRSDRAMRCPGDAL